MQLGNVWRERRCPQCKGKIDSRDEIILEHESIYHKTCHENALRQLAIAHKRAMEALGCINIAVAEYVAFRDVV